MISAMVRLPDGVVLDYDSFTRSAFVRLNGERIGHINCLYQAKPYAGDGTMPYSKPLGSVEEAVDYLLEEWRKHEEGDTQ